MAFPTAEGIATMSTDYHLAQLNIGRMIAPLGDPKMVEFKQKITTINRSAEQSPGFVWRLPTDEAHALGAELFDDNRLHVNLSVWETVEDMHNFVYQGDHAAVLRSRRQWFERLDGPTMVLWWTPSGYQPTLEEAKVRLETLAVMGPTLVAFTLGRFFPDPEQWEEQLPVEPSYPEVSNA